MRLFAALELPGEVRSALASWGARVSAREPAVRLISTESLHVTIVFLGTQAAEDAEAIGSAVVGAARRLSPLAVTAAAWLPSRRPGVLAADVVEYGTRLADLRSDLLEALRPWHEPEERSFRAHITVARVRRDERPQLREVPAPPRLIFEATALVLYRSHPGSRYETLARAAI